MSFRRSQCSQSCHTSISSFLLHTVAHVSTVGLHHASIPSYLTIEAVSEGTAEALKHPHNSRQYIVPTPTTASGDRERQAPRRRI